MAFAPGRRWSWGIVLLVLMIAVPLTWSSLYAALYSFGFIGRFSDGATTRHWLAAWSTGGLLASVTYSAGVAMMATFLAYSLAMIGVLWFPETRNQRIRLALLAIPLAMPPAVVAITAFQILNPGGWLARVAFAVGLLQSPAQFPEFVQDQWSIGLILGQAALSFPILLLYLLKNWNSGQLDQYCQLARSLGATGWQIRLRVALPILIQRARSFVMLTFLINLGAYELPLLLGRQAPQMFAVLTQRRFVLYDLTQRPQAFALALTYFIGVSGGLLLLLAWRRSR